MEYLHCVGPELVCDKPTWHLYLSGSDSFNKGTVSQLMDFPGGKRIDGSVRENKENKSISTLISFLLNQVRPPLSSRFSPSSCLSWLLNAPASLEQ